MNKKPPQPGVYYGLSIDEYHSSPGISKSGLDDIARSPAIYKALRSPNAPAKVEKASQLHGNLAHCAFLEPKTFTSRYAIGPTVSRSTKEWKEFVGNTSLTAIQKEQQEAAFAQAESLMALTNVYQTTHMAEIMNHGNPEVSAFANVPNTGVLCRVRRDWVFDLNEKEVVLVDCKTVGSALADGFLMQAKKLRYVVQAKFYSDVYEWASGKKVVGFVFANVETAWPYAAASYDFGDQSMHEGWLQYRENLDKYAECLKRDRWPGIASQTTTVDLPYYALTEEEVELE